jgi:hypothetical protein
MLSVTTKTTTTTTTTTPKTQIPQQTESKLPNHDDDDLINEVKATTDSEQQQQQQTIEKGQQEGNMSSYQNVLEKIPPQMKENSIQQQQQQQQRQHCKQQQQQSTKSFPYQYIPLSMGGTDGRTHLVSEESRALIQREVTLHDLELVMNAFYDKAFQDHVLDKFIRSHSDDHGRRFATWIYQNLSNVPVWDEHRQSRNKTPVAIAEGSQHIVVHDLASAHVAARHSPKRPSSEMGRPFGLDECRVWMRLHFWALRESNVVHKSPSFVDYYVRFIAHFIGVYENTATLFARDSYRWSGNHHSTQQYRANGHYMPDIMGLPLNNAKKQIPAADVADVDWPYVVRNPWNPAIDDLAVSVTH